MSESVTHSRPLIRSASADHFAGGTTPIVSRVLAQSTRSLPGLMERRRAKPIICSVLIGKAIGIIEAKKVGTLLSGVAEQSAQYAESLPDFMEAVVSGRLPFVYESTGAQTFFSDYRDPDPRARDVFAFHRPETLRAWASEPSSLRTRLRQMPLLITNGMRHCQIEAMHNLEASFAENHPRALIQMATGAGKTFTAVSFIYRLIKDAGARRVLFLVDTSNLGRQTGKRPKIKWRLIVRNDSDSSLPEHGDPWTAQDRMNSSASF